MAQFYGSAATPEMINFSALKVSYDEIADVLYLSVGDPQRAARTKEDEQGLLWRMNVGGEIGGVTVLAFHQLWGENATELATILSRGLKVSATDVRDSLEAAH